MIELDVKQRQRDRVAEIYQYTVIQGEKTTMNRKTLGKKTLGRWKGRY